MEPIENWNMLDILPEGEVKDKAQKTIDEFYEVRAAQLSDVIKMLGDDTLFRKLGEDTFSSRSVDVPKIKIYGENK